MHVIVQIYPKYVYDSMIITFLWYMHGVVFHKSHLLGSSFLNKNILPNMQRCAVSFGATFLILFYDTRVWFWRCSQGRYGEKYVNPVCLSWSIIRKQAFNHILGTRCRHLRLPNCTNMQRSVKPSVTLLWKSRKDAFCDTVEAQNTFKTNICFTFQNWSFWFNNGSATEIRWNIFQPCIIWATISIY
jgi:hypothetical protein